MQQKFFSNYQQLLTFLEKNYDVEINRDSAYFNVSIMGFKGKKKGEDSGFHIMARSPLKLFIFLRDELGVDLNTTKSIRNPNGSFMLWGEFPENVTEESTETSPEEDSPDDNTSPDSVPEETTSSDNLLEETTSESPSEEDIPEEDTLGEDTPSESDSIEDIISQANALYDESDKRGSKDKLELLGREHAVELAKNKSFENMVKDLQDELEKLASE